MTLALLVKSKGTNVWYYLKAASLGYRLMYVTVDINGFDHVLWRESVKTEFCKQCYC